VLAGDTYASRLWCAMELFIFVRMKGQHDEIDVRLILRAPDEDGLAVAAADEIKSRIARFDAGKAKCSQSGDRHRLLGAIEATYGTPAPFNDIVRSLLAEKLGGGGDGGGDDGGVGGGVGHVSSSTELPEAVSATSTSSPTVEESMV
jgi:hypothetical protein